MSKLEELVAAAREDVEDRKRAVPISQLHDQIGTTGGARPFNEALARPGLSLVAEFKRRSPSAGAIADASSVDDVVRAYERGGAAALSILTDGPNFGGSLDDLRVARAASSLPILRKDFIVDPYQLAEAAVNGADAVLLIVAALDDETLGLLHEEARTLDLDCLVEVHNSDELERALAVGADVLGINNRDLRDMSVDSARTNELMPDIPAGKTVVSESGYQRRDQLEELERIGVDAVLVGEALMRSQSPEDSIRELTSDEEATREHYLGRAAQE